MSKLPMLATPLVFLGLAWAPSLRAEPAGPAYVVESSAPANSVPIDPTSAAPAEGAAAEVPVDPGIALYSSTVDDPDAAPPVPPDAPAAVGTELPPPATNYRDDDPRALQDFTPRLDPYGTWVDDASYGLIWVPDRAIVGDSFSPYVSGGHWALDTVGDWVWVSDYPFGAVVFHYGRWAWTSRGWVWVPGYRYAPAWVSWRVPAGDYAYYGWAPIPPTFVWMNGSPVSLSSVGAYYWVFCSSAFLFSPSPSLYVVHSSADARVLAQNTKRYAAPSPRAGAPSPAAVRTAKYAWPVPKLFNARPAAYRPSLASSGVVAPVAVRPAAPVRRAAAAPARVSVSFAGRPSVGRTR